MNHEKPDLFRAIVFSFIFCFPLVSEAKSELCNLLCEYKTNPLGIAATQPRLSWQIKSDEYNVQQSAYEIRVAKSKDKLLKKHDLLWTSGKVNSAQSLHVQYNGPVLNSGERVWWQVRIWDQNSKATKWSEAAWWETGLLDTADWEAAWISHPDEAKEGTAIPVRYFRNEFRSTKKIAAARLYVSAKGLYEIYLNGRKVGDQLFTPGWTSYNKRIQYQTYDVTNLLASTNVISALLGEGWYSGYIGFSGQRNYYGDQPALIAQLHIKYTDGSVEIRGTDGSWKVTTGAIRQSDIYNGELYDASLEMPGWKTSAFDDSHWKIAAETDQSKATLIASQGAPVKAIETLKARELIITPNREMVFDMGQNMVGWVRIKLQGEKGDTVKLKFAEVLDKDGNFYTANLRAAKCTDTYVFGRTGEVVYEPKFTFHGFRFVQVIGMDKAPALDDVTGVVIHSEMKPTGIFACSDSLINQLQHNIQWGQKGNFLDVPTDCPQRDERLGWTGDAQVFSRTAAFNFNVATFYTKWMKDLVLDQLPNGKVPHVIPDVLNGNGGATGWADAVAIIPWTVYQMYGEKGILEDCYPALVKWIGYMQARAGSDYLWTGDDHFGDWLAFATTRSDYPGATTEKDLLATAYFYYTTSLAAKMAGILNKPADRQEFDRLAGNVKNAFVQEFVTPNGRLVSHTQTAYVLALSFGLVPDNLIEKAAAYLAQDVEKFGHLTTGFLGTPLLCHTLSAIGRDDLSYMLLNRTEYPSWLYPVTQGATTIWERWDGQKPDGSFQNVGMNSFNHYAYGAIGDWLYSRVAGIKIDENHPAYKHFILAPHPGGGLSFATATFSSMYGLIVSHWKIEDNRMTYSVEIPANTTADVVLPNAQLSKVICNEKRMENATQTGSKVEITLGSGKYNFSYPVVTE